MERTDMDGKSLLAIVVALVVSLTLGCETPRPDAPEEPPAQEPPAEEPPVEDDEPEGPTLVEPSQQSAELMELIADYEEWGFHAGVDSHTPSGHPGEIWVIAYANPAGIAMVEEQQVPAPQGVILVKEEYDADDADEPTAVTVMQKLSDEQGDWYWMKTDPDLESIVRTADGMVLEGTENLGCIDCHAAQADQDYVMTPQF